MRFILKLGIFCAVIYFFVFSTGLISDNAQLKNSLIRLHVVANSDSEEDQQIKLQVRDAVLAYLEPVMQAITSKEEAVQFIQENMQKIENIANEVLKSLGESQTANVSFLQEKFDIRNYETFSLPSGIYDALRIEIGEGEGENWWCVAFPTLCMPTTEADFEATAVSSGFSDTLVSTITEDRQYQIRFLFLDWIGRMENFFN